MDVPADPFANRGGETIKEEESADQAVFIDDTGKATTDVFDNKD